MIENFEEITEELTDFEKELLPNFITQLEKKKGAKNAVKSTQIIESYKKKGTVITGARVRKIINYIRIHGLVQNLMATSKGYYIATDRSEMQSYADSLDQRINSIIAVRDQIVHQMNTNFKP